MSKRKDSDPVVSFFNLIFEGIGSFVLKVALVAFLVALVLGGGTVYLLMK